MIIALKVIVNNMLCLANIVHLYLSAFKYMFFSDISLFMVSGQVILFLKINSKHSE